MDVIRVRGLKYIKAGENDSYNNEKILKVLILNFRNIIQYQY